MIASTETHNDTHTREIGLKEDAVVAEIARSDEEVRAPKTENERGIEVTDRKELKGREARETEVTDEVAMIEIDEVKSLEVPETTLMLRIRQVVTSLTNAEAGAEIKI